MHQAYGLSIPTTLTEVCDPHTMALLVYDMQVGIAGRLPNAAPVIAQAQQVLTAARQAGMRVFFCRHMALPNEVAGVSQLRSAMALQRVTEPTAVVPTFLRDAPGFPIIPELAPLPTEAVFDKLMRSAFVGSLLDVAWRDARITAFAIVGAVLEIGIEPTVRHGADLGYQPVVITDACYALNDAARQRTLDGLQRVALQADTSAFVHAVAGQPRRT